jgi:MFS transporter, NNP family, nitrate/nitrite transporter
MLSAAAMTALLTFAYDYPTFLLAALGVGIAGGSFSVGIAYVSKWYPKERQGIALGNRAGADRRRVLPVHQGRS